MTSKIYKTAQGKTVDLGTIMLQNEHVRAVGNMNVNARGDKLDSNNRVVETKPKQIQRQNARITNVSAAPIQTSSNKSKKAKAPAESPAPQVAPTAKVETPPPSAPKASVKTQHSTPKAKVETPPPALTPIETIIPEEEPTPVVSPPVQNVSTPKPSQGGLAAAIARNKEVKQELEKTRRQQQQSQGVRRI